MAQLSPIFNLPFFTDDEGNPLAGGKIFTYEGGSSSVLKTTYTGPSEAIANSNPIVLNSAGQLPAGVSIWLIASEAYNLVLTASDGITVLKQFDDVTGIIPPPASGEVVANPIWVDTAVPTYLAPTQFLVPGNFSSQFAVGNRARLTLSTGFAYGTVTAVSFSSPNTTVTVALDGGATLNGTISKAEYSLLIAAGKTVDAGGVSYTNPFNYSVPNTVGYKLNETVTNLDNVNTALNSKIARSAAVWVTTGSGSNTPYVITPTPALTTYSIDGALLVRFAAASSGSPTLNVNALGAAPLLQFNGDTNTLEPAVVSAGLLSQVVFDGGNFILLDRTYSTYIQPHGWQLFTSNDVFTVPSGAYSLKVTVTGGGGGGGEGSYGGGENPVQYAGGSGGPGGTVTNYVQTTPGTTFSVTIGVGGTAGASIPGGNGGTGGTSTFGGSLLIAGGGTGGTAGVFGNGTNGSRGSVSGGASMNPIVYQYGNGGTAGDGVNPSGAGVSGIVVVEW